MSKNEGSWLSFLYTCLMIVFVLLTLALFTDQFMENKRIEKQKELEIEKKFRLTDSL